MIEMGNEIKNDKKIHKAKGKSLKEKLIRLGKIISVIDVFGAVVIFSFVSFGWPGSAKSETVAETTVSANADKLREATQKNRAVVSESPAGLPATLSDQDTLDKSYSEHSAESTPQTANTENGTAAEAPSRGPETASAVSLESSDDLGRSASDGSASSEAISTEGNADEGAIGNVPTAGAISLNPSWKYADMSVINSGQAVMYTAKDKRKGKVVALNAGHGTSGGESVKTYCHPDKTAKVTGGTTAAGSYQAVAVSSGMTFRDGTPEKTVTLRMANILKDKLLAAGYDVLMLRDGEDVQLDNIARTVIANNKADIHIALHWDGDGLDTIKGVFYMSVPDALKSMEPVSSYWQAHEALGDALIAGLKGQGIKIWGSNPLDMDLTQTSYSTIPSVDIELGNQCSNHSDEMLNTEANGLLDGINAYFGG